MKFMKLGTRPDTFYTEQATRTVVSDLPVDLVIKIDDITYLLHKSPLLSKCGLLQRLCSDSRDSESVSIELHDLPGGADAFELCAKFCYGISINISAHNIVSALCSAKFLQMNDSTEKGNFVGKLEAFFSSCILEGWKDSIVTLQTTDKLPEWPENLGITRKCIDSIVEKILTAPSQVRWSYTYTRPGYTQKKHHSVPKDWWTEDVCDLNIDLFRCIIMAIRSTYVLPPQLIGEALHVYAYKMLPGVTKLKSSGTSASSQTEESKKDRKILETIVSMIPADRGSVSVGFLLRLLSISGHVSVSPLTKTELIKRASIQFDEATMKDLLYDQNVYDIELVLAVSESFLKLWKRMFSGAVDNRNFLRSIRNVGKLIDSYLQVVARDDNLPVSKFVALAETVPTIGRLEHDDLYQAINFYLKVHPDLSKADKKRMCQILDCQRLSPEVRAHAVKNDLLPLRTVVQLLYFEQEKSSKVTTTSHKLQKPHELVKKTPATRDSLGKQTLELEKEELDREEVLTRKTSLNESREKGTHKTKRSDGKLALELERKMVIRGETEEKRTEKGSGVKEEGGLKGKDDSATKSAKGRRVQFSKEGPFESMMSDSPNAGGKGDFSKGGKGDKVANGKKTSASKEAQASDPKIGQELPENVKCLMDCEAADILQRIQDQMVNLSRDPSIKIPVSFDKGLQYAKSNSKYAKPESVGQNLQHLAGYGVSDSEICVIGNACPDTADEAYALIPSLKGKRSLTGEIVEDALTELAKLRQPI
ncbi:hypothetical protein TanjilG_27147 [Lupinus angustifolius]|uniref:NPH3 domain-containing protein n=1 Tax=Lupinus angustifolius TaxID=3871 RepID=A0A4P1QW29_LUPAN|nr:hypothetical protein TanjilG_27147 [Lupinus angustifolius]